MICDNAKRLKQTVQSFLFAKMFNLKHNIPINFQNTFRTPVYVTSERRNAMGVGLVFEADLATHEHISHWVLQGVCLTLNSD